MIGQFCEFSSVRCYVGCYENGRSIGHMGTIVSRRRKDGPLGYTAQIRIHRQGKCIHSESETFDRRQLATEWMRRREAELDQQRARGEPLGKGAIARKPGSAP